MYQLDERSFFLIIILDLFDNINLQQKNEIQLKFKSNINFYYFPGKKPYS